MGLLVEPLAAFSELHFAYKLVLTCVLVIILRKLSVNSKPYKNFPVWATIELGLASYILRGNGPSRRLL